MINIKTILSVSVISLSLLFVGCGTSPKTQIYILNTIDQDTSVQETDAQSLVIKVGPVSIPDTLDQEPIVTRTGLNSLNADEYNRWSGNFQDDIQRTLGENISILLPNTQIVLGRETILVPIDYQVIINVREFYGQLGDSVILNASWTLAQKNKKKKVVVSKKIVLKEKTQGVEYRHYVAAQSRLLAKLSQKIADEIKKQFVK